MDMNKFTQKSIESIKNAERLAIEHGHMEIEPEHLLYALLTQDQGIVPRILSKMGKQVERLITDLQQTIDKKVKVSGPGREAGKIYISRNTDVILTQALKESENFKDLYVSVEHIFLAFYYLDNSTLTSTLLAKYNIEKKEVLNVLKAIRGNQQVTSDRPESTYDALSQYGHDLVEDQLGEIS